MCVSVCVRVDVCVRARLQLQASNWLSPIMYVCVCT
jgi:hypothetical protein